MVNLMEVLLGKEYMEQLKVEKEKQKIMDAWQKNNPKCKHLCYDCIESIRKMNEGTADDDKCVPPCVNGFDYANDYGNCAVIQDAIGSLNDDAIMKAVGIEVDDESQV